MLAVALKTGGLFLLLSAFHEPETLESAKLKALSTTAALEDSSERQSERVKDVQVTYLEIHIRNELDSQPAAANKESALAALACIVVACSARLEGLDLRLDWCCADAYAQNLLVRLSWLLPYTS